MISFTTSACSTVSPDFSVIPCASSLPKAEFGDDMPDTEEKGPVLFPMSTLPEEHLFKMQTAEAQATTSNAVQSEDDRQQIRRITVKL